MIWGIRKIGTVTVLAGGLALGAGFAADRDAPRLGLGTFMSHPIRQLILGQQGRLLVLRSTLDLSDAQRNQLRTIVDSHRGQIDQVVQELVSEHRALRATVVADKPDEQSIRAAANDMNKGIGDAAVLIAQIRSEARPLLTPAQRQAIESYRADSDKAVDQFLQEFGQATTQP